MLSNVTATVCAVFVVRDALFVAISLVNLLGCGAAAVIAARRRAQWRAVRAARLARSREEVAP